VWRWPSRAQEEDRPGSADREGAHKETSARPAGFLERGPAWTQHRPRRIPSDSTGARPMLRGADESVVRPGEPALARKEGGAFSKARLLFQRKPRRSSTDVPGRSFMSQTPTAAQPWPLADSARGLRRRHESEPSFQRAQPRAAQPARRHASSTRSSPRQFGSSLRQSARARWASCSHRYTSIASGSPASTSAYNCIAGNAIPLAAVYQAL
jgi:hypothetical protein